jgi:urease accessory protein
MIAVGVLAAQLGGRALWLVPVSFLGVMVVGGAFGMAGVLLPFAELGVALSVIVFGLGIALPFRLRTLAVMTLVSLFALFHGHVHGHEMPVATSAMYYTAGFVGATALLHAVGVGFGSLAGLVRTELGHSLVQAAGGAMALFGVTVLTDLL